jgi:uncharacterized protein
VSFYLDASVLVATLVQEASTSAVLRFLSQASEPLLVSDFAAAEVASRLSRLIRMHKMTAEAARNALDRFDIWRQSDSRRTEIDNSDIVEANGLVRRFELKLRTSDALHLAVSLRISAKLVTLDGALAKAAVACQAVAIHP